MPDPRPTEADCQKTIVAAAIMLGYRVHHTRPAQTRRGWRTPMIGHVGFPDLVIAGHGRIWFVELKRKPNKVDDPQQHWLAALTLAGADARVVWVPDGQQSFIDEMTAATRKGAA